MKRPTPSGGFGADLPDLYTDESGKSGTRMVLPFGNGRIEVQSGVFDRIEFTGKWCNLTLKNSTAKSRRVQIVVHVLSSQLIELWRESVHWRLKKLQPEQIASETWKFEPKMPETVWSRQLRDDDQPAWVVIVMRE